MFDKKVTQEHFSRLTFISYSLDTGCELNIHKTFKGHSRCIPNVLCRFNFSPVPKNYVGHRNNFLIKLQVDGFLLKQLRESGDSFWNTQGNTSPMFQNCLSFANVKIVKSSRVSLSLKRKHNKIHNIPNIEMFQIKHSQFLNLFLKFLDKQHSHNFRTILEYWPGKSSLSWFWKHLLLGSKIWEVAPVEIKEAHFLNSFKIWKWVSKKNPYQALPTTCKWYWFSLIISSYIC